MNYTDVIKLLENELLNQRITDLIYIKNVYDNKYPQISAELDNKPLLKRNLLKKIIIKKRRMLYNTPPTRLLLSDILTTKKFELGILPEFNNLMSDIVRLTELYGYCYYSKSLGVIPPYLVYMDGNKFLVHKEVFQTTRSKTVFDWVYQDGVRYVFENNKVVSVDLEQILPIVKNYDSGLPAIESMDLAELQTQIVNIYNFLKYSHILQSTNPIFTDDLALTAIDLSPSKINFKSKDSKIERLTLTPQLESTLNFIEHLNDSFFEEAGIPKVAVVGDVNVSSAKELIVKWYPLIEIFNELASFYSRTEEKLVKYILENENLVYTVKFDSSFIPKTGGDLNETRFKFENDIITKRDLIKTENPTLTDEQVEVQLQENIQQNKINPIKQKEVTQNV